MPKDISKLESLRTLRSYPYFLSLSIEEESVLRLEDVGKMNEIEEMAFKVEHESQLKRMEEGILAPLLNMRRLEVENKIDGMQCLSESALAQFPETMSAMKDLEHLSLTKFAVPSWICCLANLRLLYLGDCHCSNYPELEAMPNLVSLVLWGNKICRELPKAFGKSGGFPHLRFLWILGFPELEEFPEIGTVEGWGQVMEEGKVMMGIVVALVLPGAVAVVVGITVTDLVVKSQVYVARSTQHKPGKKSFVLTEERRSKNFTQKCSTNVQLRTAVL